jgi:hypothetical protein
MTESVSMVYKRRKMEGKSKEKRKDLHSIEKQSRKKHTRSQGTVLHM